mgnify:CR=1 FL=1
MLTKQQSEKAVQQVLQSVELPKLSKKDQATLIRRLEQHLPTLISQLHDLYGERYDFFFHIQQLVARLAQAFSARRSALKQQDLQRLNNPTWYRDEAMLGMAVYVDLFAGDLVKLKEFNLENRFIVSSVGRVTQLKDYETFIKAISLIKKEIFNPLNMEYSSFIWNDYIQKHRAKGHYRGKLNAGYAINAKNPDFIAAGSLQTDPVAYANFLIAIMTHEILSEKSYEELLKIQSIAPADKKYNEPSYNYGLGIVVEPSAYGTNYSHGGDNLSHTCRYMLNIEQKVGYVFFTNSEHKETFDKNLIAFLLSQ